MASGTDSQGNSGQAAIDRFAAMMIERMQQMKDTGLPDGNRDGLAVHRVMPDCRRMWVAETIPVPIPSFFRCILQP